MSWKESYRMDQRIEFIARLLKGERMTDLCREFDISRKTGYKFLNRYNDYGAGGLSDASRRPIRFARQTEGQIERMIVDLKTVYPSWGPKKLKTRLEILHPEFCFPSPSTIGEILTRHGLVKSRRKKPIEETLPILGSNSVECEGDRPNYTWCVDFKGQFRLGDGSYCYPLTVTDYASRYLLACEALVSTKASPVIAIFDELFDRYGMPLVIKSDNGSPFGARGFGGLSQLSAYWMSLGIRPNRSRPGHPQDNGRHERMHRTLKAEATRPAGKNILQQQEKLDSFREIYNEQRPHEALGMKTPASLYQRSERSFGDAQKHQLFESCDKRYTINQSGVIKSNGRYVFIGRALKDLAVGIREITDKVWTVHLGVFDLGFIDWGKRRFQITNPLREDDDEVEL